MITPDRLTLPQNGYKKKPLKQSHEHHLDYHSPQAINAPTIAASVRTRMIVCLKNLPKHCILQEIIPPHFMVPFVLPLCHCLVPGATLERLFSFSEGKNNYLTTFSPFPGSRSVTARVQFVFFLCFILVCWIRFARGHLTNFGVVVSMRFFLFSLAILVLFSLAAYYLR